MYTNNFLWLCIGIMSRAAVQTAGHCQCMLEHVCVVGVSVTTPFLSTLFTFQNVPTKWPLFFIFTLFPAYVLPTDRPSDGTNEQTTDPSFHLLVLLQGPPLCVKGFLFRHDENWETVGQSNSITRCYFTFFPPFLLRLLFHRYYPVKERKNVLSFGFLWTLVTSFFVDYLLLYFFRIILLLLL